MIQIDVILRLASALLHICKLVLYNKVYNIVKHEKHCEYGEIQEILA